MQVTERHVFTLEEPPVIRTVLNVLSAGVESDGSGPLGTCNMLGEFAKRGCNALLLNLRVMEEPLEPTSPKIRNVGATLLGGVLIVACQVTAPWILQIEELSHCRSVPEYPISRLGAFVHALF
jgi:hypothetical protein